MIKIFDRSLDLTSNWLKTPDQFLFYLSLVKYSKNYFQSNLWLSVRRRSIKSQPVWLRPSESCINQLLAVTHKTFEAFDCNPPLEVRSFCRYVKRFGQGLA